MADPYARLLQLAQGELEAVEAGDWERVTVIQGEQAALRDTLAGAPPAWARTSLEEAVRLNAEVARSIQRALAAVQAELVGLGRSREAATGYGAAVERAPGLAWQG